MTQTTGLLEVPPKRRTLYAILSDMEALDAILSEIGGDLTDEEVEAAVNEWAMENLTNLQSKVDNIVRLVKDKEARRDALKIEAQRLRDRAEVEDNGVKRIKAMCHRLMDLNGMTKANGDLHTISIVNNGGVAPLTVFITEPKELPEQFQKWTVAADNAKIRAALEAGDAEAATIAEISPRGVSVRMK